MKDVESQMKRIVTSLDSVIMTIPGIGFINGGMILGEIGDIARFSNPPKVLAFSGPDPAVYQSGNFNALSHCAGKLVRIIYKMLTDNVEFKLD